MFKKTILASKNNLPDRPDVGYCSIVLCMNSYRHCTLYSVQHPHLILGASWPCLPCMTSIDDPVCHVWPPLMTLSAMDDFPWLPCLPWMTYLDDPVCHVWPTLMILSAMYDLPWWPCPLWMTHLYDPVCHGLWWDLEEEALVEQRVVVTATEYL